MKAPTHEEQKTLVQQWKKASAALQLARDDELRSTPYDWTVVDALLEIGANSPRHERQTSGLVEMQRLFMKLAGQQGLLPAVPVATAKG